MNPLVVLFWDIDGTLLTTARGGIGAFERAVKAICGVEASLAELFTSGLTDAEVAALVLETIGIDATADIVERILREYERGLPGALPERKGHVMPNVREILEAQRDRSDVRSYLLTGNTPGGARAKLTHYGLAEFFDLDGDAGAFCAGPGARVEIARRARPLAEGVDLVYVIGDTPQDIACGDAIDARTIAVATGRHSLDELRAHEPWALLEQLPEPAAFAELVGLEP